MAPRKMSKAEVKAAVDRAERRSRGEPVEAPKSPVMDPPETAVVRSKGGRPTKYKPEMCQVVIDAGSEGKSKAQIARILGVTRETVDIWGKTHVEFSDSLKIAKDLALAWWEDQGQTGVWAGKSFNATAYIFQMKNRFPADYRDVSAHELTGRDGGPIETKDTSDLEMARKVAFLLGRAVGRAEPAKTKSSVGTA